MFRWALHCQFRQFERNPDFVVGQVLSYSSGEQLLYMEVQYMFTLDRICMGYLCFSEIHKTMTWVSESLTCLYDLLMHTYTHMFTFIYSVRLNGCLF